MKNKLPHITIQLFYEDGEFLDFSTELPFKEINKNTLDKAFTEIFKVEYLKGFDYLTGIYKCVYFKNVRKIQILVFDQYGTQITFPR